MKRLMLTAAAFALLTTAAHADDSDVATGIATMMTYDVKCEKLPIVFIDLSVRVLETIPVSTFKTATQKVLALYISAGPAAFCAANKPVIDRAMANYRP